MEKTSEKELEGTAIYFSRRPGTGISKSPAFFLK
jgi:hypothetical protein